MEQTKNIALAALNIARHIHDEAYDGVIVSGGSHEVSRALLALGWNALYPGTRMPHEFVLGSTANSLLYKRHATASYPHDFEVWMDAHMPELAASRDKPLCFLDDYALGGDKYRGVSVALRLLGFHHMDFAFFAARENTELPRNVEVGVRSTEVLLQLRELGQHLQGKEDADELLNPVREEARLLRGRAVGELREVGQELKHTDR